MKRCCWRTTCRWLDEVLLVGRRTVSERGAVRAQRGRGIRTRVEMHGGLQGLGELHLAVERPRRERCGISRMRTEGQRASLLCGANANALDERRYLGGVES